MATKAEEREWIAMHLYEESRFETYLKNKRKHPPMWHELDAEQQREWTHKAARLQEWLVTCRRFHRAS